MYVGKGDKRGKPRMSSALLRSFIAALGQAYGLCAIPSGLVVDKDRERIGIIYRETFALIPAYPPVELSRRGKQHAAKSHIWGSESSG